MKRIMALLLAAALFCLSGCSLTPTSMESLLSPPVRTEEQSEIYQALLSSVPPQRGIHLCLCGGGH